MTTPTPKKEHFVLQPEIAKEHTAPGAVKSIVEDVLERVSKSVGESPTDVRVLANAGAVSLAASPRFLRSLAEQPEMARRISPEANPSLIQPVKKRQVSLAGATGVKAAKPRKS